MHTYTHLALFTVHLNAYIVRDDTEYASGQFLPLWSFGLLY